MCVKLQLCLPHTLCCKLRRVEDFDLHKRLYQGKASLLYSATCKKSLLPVAVKVYRKARLSELNWYQVGCYQETAVPALAHVQLPSIVRLSMCMSCSMQSGNLVQSSLLLK